MSRKWFEMLAVGSGTTNREVKSSFGEKILKKMNWDKGDLLGKKKEDMMGLAEPVQMKRRAENLGMGAEEMNEKQRWKWDSKPWEDAFNSTISKLDVIEKKRNEQSDSSSSDSSDSDDSIIITKCTRRILIPRDE